MYIKQVRPTHPSYPSWAGGDRSLRRGCRRRPRGLSPLPAGWDQGEWGRRGTPAPPRMGAPLCSPGLPAGRSSGGWISERFGGGGRRAAGRGRACLGPWRRRRAPKAVLSCAAGMARHRPFAWGAWKGGLPGCPLRHGWVRGFSLQDLRAVKGILLLGSSSRSAFSFSCLLLSKWSSRARVGPLQR